MKTQTLWNALQGREPKIQFIPLQFSEKAQKRIKAGMKKYFPLLAPTEISEQHGSDRFYRRKLYGADDIPDMPTQPEPTVVGAYTHQRDGEMYEFTKARFSNGRVIFVEYALNVPPATSTTIDPADLIGLTLSQVRDLQRAQPNFQD